MPRNWIIADGLDGSGNAIGIPINLDWVTKVAWGGNFPTAKPLQVVFYHGIQGLTAGSNGSQTCITYASATTAKAAYTRICKILARQEIAYDLSVYEVSISTVTTDPDPLVAAAGGTVTLTGGGFRSTGKVVINSVEMTGTASADGTTFTFAVGAGAIAAGTYAVEYYDEDGNAARKAAGITLT